MDKLVSNDYGYVENKKNHYEFKNKDVFDTLNPLWSKLHNDIPLNNELNREQSIINKSLCYSILILSKRTNEQLNYLTKEINEIKNEVKELKEKNKFNN